MQISHTPGTADESAEQASSLSMKSDRKVRSGGSARGLLSPFGTVFAEQAGLAVAISLVMVLVLLGSKFYPIRYLENWASDIRIALLNPVAPNHPDVVMVEITEETLARLKRRSPIDRGFLSALLRQLESAGVQAVGLDILLDQPSEEAKDAMLIGTLQGISVPVVLAWGDVATSDGFMQPWQEEYLQSFLARIDNPHVTGAAANLRVDDDGTVRRLFTGHTGEGAPPSFSVAIARLLGRNDPPQNPRLAYYGRQWASDPPFNSIPAHYIDQSNPAVWAVTKRALKDKTVIVGANIAGADRYRTPFAADPIRGEQRTAGAFIHAHAVAQLIDGRQLGTGPVWISLLAALTMVCIGGVLGTADISAIRRSLALFAVIFAFWAGASVIFVFGGHSGPPFSTGPLIPVVLPTLGLLVCLGIGVGHARRRHREQKRYIRNVLRHYVPPTVMNELIADPSKLRLGGERREMTFIFTDIAGFTSLSESVDPAVLVATLNEYLDGMCNIIHECQGTIDKFVGDAVVAFWSAPAYQADHPALAVRCALAMDEFAQAFAGRLARQGLQLGITRIGVYTGVATVGNFGGNIRYNYTVLGDAVNIAARLESVNKHLGTRICVGGTTMEKCRHIMFRPVGDLVLKGKQVAVPVFEPAQDEATADAYTGAFELMRAGKWREAEAVLDALLTRAPEDSMAKFHLSRLKRGEYSLEIVMEEK